MKLRFLLDTNVLSEAIRPAPNLELIARMERHTGQIATASVAWHELVFGLAALPHGRRRREGEHYLERVIAPNVPVLPYDAAAASWHAHERARLKAAGKTPSFSDGQIAATAAANGLTLVTLNTRDFAHFDGLSVMSWDR